MIPPRKRFLDKLDCTAGLDGCWLWTGALCPNPNGRGTGYGHFRSSGRDYKAHRFAYELFVGPIPAGQHVLHSCDVTICCNPAHLFIGTHADNMRDREAKGRHNAPRGSRHKLSRLTEDQVREIRALYRDGMPQAHIAKRYGVVRQVIWGIVHGKGWKHVT